jgi:hypothetical protein
MNGYDRWEQERRALAGAEAEMGVAAAEARVRLRVAQAWLRSADADLAALDRLVWGGVVDEWHRAADAVADSAEAVRAYEAFGR